MQGGPNWLDKTIGFFSPIAGLKRAQARIVQSRLLDLQRSYDGASFGGRNGGWIAGSTSANTEIRGALISLRNRSRDLVRNTGYGERIVAGVAANAVGVGIICKLAGQSPRNLQSSKAIWKDWAETPACDFDERNTLYGLQYLMTRAIVESGEVIIRRRRVPVSDYLPIPLQLQILEPDFIDTSRNEISNVEGNVAYIIQGIEFDKRGKRVAYWLYPEHPGGNVTGQLQSFKSERIPADQIVHLFRVDRAGQVRGLPWKSPIMVKMKDHSDYSDATLLRQKIAACFTGFVHDTDDNGDPLQLVSNSAQGDKFQLPNTIEAGSLLQLPPGKSITIGQNPPATGFEDLSREQLREIAAGIGVTYELLTGDYSQSNFSSSRMGFLEFQRNLDIWRAHALVPHMCRRPFKWVSEAAAVAGYNFDGLIDEWTPPRREMIDPVKETQAAGQSIRYGLKSLPETIRELGYDPEDVLNEIQETNKELDEKGIVLDSDPRKTMQGGTFQAMTSPEGVSKDV